MYFAYSVVCLLMAFILPALFIHRHQGVRLSSGIVLAGVVAWGVFTLLYGVRGTQDTGAGLFLAALGFCLAMSVLDASNHWLPLEFTLAFAIVGIAAHGPGEEIFSPDGLLHFAGMFALLGTLRYVMNRRYRQEMFGMGDVWLIAGIAAWLSFLDAAIILVFTLATHIVYWLACRASHKKPPDTFPLAPLACLGFLCMTVF